MMLISWNKVIYCLRTRISPCVIIIASASALTSCSSYSASFGCGEAKGAYCIPMDKVDRMVASGEIECVMKDKVRKGREYISSRPLPNLKHQHPTTEFINQSGSK